MFSWVVIKLCYNLWQIRWSGTELQILRQRQGIFSTTPLCNRFRKYYTVKLIIMNLQHIIYWTLNMIIIRYSALSKECNSQNQCFWQLVNCPQHSRDHPATRNLRVGVSLSALTLQRGGVNNVKYHNENIMLNIIHH